MSVTKRVEKAALPLEITNLRLSHTSRPLGIDAQTPSISWGYSVPTGSHSWWQQTYILSLSSWNPGDRFKTLHEHRVLGPNTHKSWNVLWPQAFPTIQAGWVYELQVVSVMTRHARREDLKLPSSAGQAWGFGDAKGGLSLYTDIPLLELAHDFVSKLGLDLETTAVLSSDHFQFEGGIIGGFDAWQARAPGIAPICTPWDSEEWQKPKPVSVFRNSHTLKSKPQLARLYATAFGVYKVHINGKPVGDSIMEPGWTEYKLRLLYQTYDITEHLKLGENVITVAVADGWYRGRLASGWEARRAYYGQETGFMALIDVYGATGNKESFWTGESSETGWKCAKTDPMLESGIYDGESYDARIDVDKLGADDWKQAKVMTDAFTGNSRVLQASTAPPIRCTEILTVKKVLTSPAGKTILDFGQNTAGRIRFRGSAPAGKKVSFVHVEVLLPDGSPCRNILREAKATDIYIFSGSGTEEWEPEFTFHGFRYVQVDPWIEGMEVVVKVYGSDLNRGLMKFESSHKELDRLVENIRWSARANFFAVCTDCPQRDERMGWTGDINAFGPTAVYIFDCQTFLSSWLHGLVDGQQIGGRGCPPLVSPNCLQPPGSHRPTALWQDVLVTLPWYLYETYGDTYLLQSLYRAMNIYYNNGIPKNSATGLWAEGFQFGDWLDPTAPPGRPDLPATSPMFVADSWLCNITKTLTKIARVLGKHDDEEAWAEKARDIISQWRSKYINWDNDSLFQTTDTKASDLKVLTQDTQTAYSLALNFRLIPRKLRGLSVKRLNQLLEKSNYHLATGFAGTPELLHAICAPFPNSEELDHDCETLEDVCTECEEADDRQAALSSDESYSDISAISLAYKVLLGPRDPPSWLYPITMGATSIWERWDAVKPDGSVNTPGMTSLNHYAYGSCGRWIFEHIGGIKLQPFGLTGDADGMKVVFDPIPNLEFGIDRAEMAYETFVGRVECVWKYEQESKELQIEVSVPANCEAEVKIIGKTIKNMGAGKWCVKATVDEAVWRYLEQGQNAQSSPFESTSLTTMETKGETEKYLGPLIIPGHNPDATVDKAEADVEAENEHTDDEWVIVESLSRLGKD